MKLRILTIGLLNSLLSAGLMAAPRSVVAEMTEKHTEKPTAWIELHEDVLDEAYDMSKVYRKYE